LEAGAALESHGGQRGYWPLSIHSYRVPFDFRSGPFWKLTYGSFTNQTACSEARHSRDQGEDGITHPQTAAEAMIDAGKSKSVAIEEGLYPAD
jgi:hypothetical protein